MRAVRRLPILALLCSLVLPAVASARSEVFLRGFADDAAFRHLPDGQRHLALENARSAGSAFVRLGLGWSFVAPEGRRKPSRFDARNPADPRYRWLELDRALREVRAAGLRPVLTVYAAPRWAEGRDRPRRRTNFTRPGVWRPNPSELAAFLTAASRRYSGRFRDPGGPPGTFLPPVRRWQIWNEPNLWPFLQPQWERRGGRWVKSGARHYRRMLNASYRALKAVSSSNRVIAGGLAPFGDPKPTRNGGRVAPARFLRAVLCLRGRRVLRRACRSRTSFDAYAFHPYSLGGPRRTALNPDDTTIPDAPKLTRIVRTSLRAGTATPRRHKPLWVTEMGWDTKPGNPRGLRPRTQARWINDSLFVLWNSGVSLATNLLLRDSGGPRPRRVIDPARRRSGVFYRRSGVARDRRKPSFLAMRFPFVVLPRAGGRGRAWGVPPCPQPACKVIIERRRDGKWRPAASVQAGRFRVFRYTIRTGRRTVWRARIDGSAVVSMTTLPRAL